MNGKVTTVNLANLKHVDADIKWLITRAGPDVTTEGIIRVRDLSPSQDLFGKAQFWKQGMDKEQWWPWYEEAFRLELKTPEKRQSLSRVWHLVQAGHHVALVCLCKDHLRCHRRLVGEELAAHGVPVSEYESDKPKQLTLF